MKFKGSDPEVVPAGSKVVLDGNVLGNSPHVEKRVALEARTSPSLPGGLLFASCLHTLPSKRHYQLPVVLRNETQPDTTIQPRTIIAEMHAVQRIQKLLFAQFRQSPDWKNRITDQLNSMPEVFALHDLDYGHTDKVTHHIKLSDETPFKHRARLQKAQLANHQGCIHLAEFRGSLFSVDWFEVVLCP